MRNVRLKFRVLLQTTTVVLSLCLWPLPQGASIKVAPLPVNSASPSPPTAKLVFMLIAGKGPNNWPGEALLKQATLEVKNKFPNVSSRIKLNYLGETCREGEGEVCDKVEISQEEKAGNVIFYKVYFRCSGTHLGQEPVDAERIEIAAFKIARLINNHDQKSHPLGSQ